MGSNKLIDLSQQPTFHGKVVLSYQLHGKVLRKTLKFVMLSVFAALLIVVSSSKNLLT